MDKQRSQTLFVDSTEQRGGLSNKQTGGLKRTTESSGERRKGLHPIIYIMMLSDMENLLSVWENVLSMAKVTKCGQYCIKEKESAIISKIVINFYIVI